MTRIAVIVNADDLGISPEVNDATFELMSKGRISSATILANGPATRAAAVRVATFRHCSFGVHLNLTQFEPLTTGAGARLLMDEHGQMSRVNAVARPGLEFMCAAYRELCAQVERVAALGVSISHLDSHHHVHTRPFLFPVLKEIQRRYQIRRVRLAKNFYSADQPCRIDLVQKKRAYNWALRSVYATHTTDAFTEFLTYHRAETARKRSIRRVELMVHPGARYAAEETAVLEGDWLAVTDPPMRLVSYAELPEERRVSAAGASPCAEFRPCE